MEIKKHRALKIIERFSRLKIRDRDLIEVYQAFPDFAQARIYKAPKIQALHFNPSISNSIIASEFIKESLIAELCIQGYSSEHKTNLWTALGDFYIPQGQAITSSIISSIPSLWDANRIYKALLLLDDIVIDANSPHQGLHSFHQSEDVHALEFDEYIISAKKVKSSLEVIISSNSKLMEVIRFIQVVALRKKSPTPSSWGSSSWPYYIGLMALSDIFIGEASSTHVTDLIIHEAIHSLLYHVEMIESFYLLEDVSRQYRVLSPWSGRSLELHSFIHACFVWFGLWAFWYYNTDTANFSEAIISRLLKKSSKGFLKGALTMYFDEAKRFVNPDILIAIDHMQDYVINTHPKITQTL
jgi:hypothetical protein